MEELVNQWTSGRDGLLSTAREWVERAGAPRKRRRVAKDSEPRAHTSVMERRSTRSQSKLEALQDSQESLVRSQDLQAQERERTIADSDIDEEGSEYEEGRVASTPQGGDSRAQSSAPNDGLVACPVCGKRMKEEVVFTHLDHCTGDAEQSSKLSNSFTDGTHENSIPPLHPRQPAPKSPPQRLPTLAYSMLNENALRKKLRDLGIFSQGPKQLLQKRHTEWVNLWNANCDSSSPRTKRELLQELDVWERNLGRQIGGGMASGVTAGPSGTAGGGGGASGGVMSKEFDGGKWIKSQKAEFDDLVRKARERGTRGKPAPRGYEKQQGQVDSDPDHTPPLPEPPPTTEQALPARGGRGGSQPVVDLTSPPKPAAEPPVEEALPASQRSQVYA